MRSSKIQIIMLFWIFLSTIPLVLLLPGFAVAETATIRDGRSTVQVDSIAFPTDQSPPIQTEKIDKVGEKLGDKIDKVGSRASFKFGDWVRKEAFMGITWLKLFACALLLLFVIALERVFRAWLTKMQRKAQRREGQTTWSTASLGAILGPVSLLILVYGTYGALSPLFAHLKSPDGSNIVRKIAATAADMGGMIALIWLAYRFVHAVDAQLRKSLPLKSNALDVLIKQCRVPIKVLVLIIVTRMALPFLNSLPNLFDVVAQVLSLALIGAVAWLLIEIVNGFGEIALEFYTIKVDDNLNARRIQTTVHFVKRLTMAVIMVLAATSILMMFEKVRQIGTGLLASAGILGIVAGLAAQRSIANLLVGIQMAVTQPVRIDDVVIVEDEWGKVEEINSTYAVIRIWDERRMIVPLTYFTEKPFENWTRTSSGLLCAVTLFVDYAVPVDSIRKNLNEILERSRYWDRKVAGVQVTGATERAMELRALMSARDASDAWNLRCEVREQLINFIQKGFPDGFPKVRARFEDQTSSGAFVTAQKAGECWRQRDTVKHRFDDN